MKIDAFITSYKVAKDKEEFMKKHLKTTYLPYATKIAICKSVLDSSMYITVNEKQVLSSNEPMKYMLFVMAMIDNYTDVDIPQDGEGRIAIFEEFEKNQVTADLFNALGGEYSSISTILRMMTDDLFANEQNLITWLDSKIEASNIALGTIMEAIGTVIENQNSEELPEE